MRFSDTTIAVASQVAFGMLYLLAAVAFVGACAASALLLGKPSQERVAALNETRANVFYKTLVDAGVDADTALEKTEAYRKGIVEKATAS